MYLLSCRQLAGINTFDPHNDPVRQFHYPFCLQMEKLGLGFQPRRQAGSRACIHDPFTMMPQMRIESAKPWIPYGSAHSRWEQIASAPAKRCKMTLREWKYLNPVRGGEYLKPRNQLLYRKQWAASLVIFVHQIEQEIEGLKEADISRS